MPEELRSADDGIALSGLINDFQSSARFSLNLFGRWMHRNKDAGSGQDPFLLLNGFLYFYLIISTAGWNILLSYPQNSHIPMRSADSNLI